jgi:hypothetical protein
MAKIPNSRQANNTGLPDKLKSGIEQLSGMSMDDVKVHYNSSQAAQLDALAYAQGTDVHVASGQERHLPHEAWHVVQQAQGRVQPTMQIKDGIPVNDDERLEREADVMGAKALQMRSSDQVDRGPIAHAATPGSGLAVQRVGEKQPTIQLEGGVFGDYGRDGKKKSQKVIRMEEFGDINRVHRIDPNKIEELLAEDDPAKMGIDTDKDIDKKKGIWRPSKDAGTARPEDPPVYQPFRKAFHETHNIKLSLERDMDDFVKLDAKEQFTDKLLKIAGDVKKISLHYKAKVRTFDEKATVSKLKEAYFAELEKKKTEVESLGKAMMKSYVEADDALAELAGEEGLLDELKEDKSKSGEEIWRQRWSAAIQEINKILKAQWGEHKPKIKSWVKGLRDDEQHGLPYMEPGMVGDLDYIGSLAKGYKSAPKQYLRFLPEKFDVDANLDAPPLAVFLISKGAVVDRGSVRNNGRIEPVTTFEKAVRKEMLEFAEDSNFEGEATGAKVPGVDIEDLFEVFIGAGNVTDIMVGKHKDVDTAHKKVAFSERLQDIQNRIWWLRSENMDESAKLGDKLKAKGYVTETGLLKEYDPTVGKEHADKRTYSEADLTIMELYLKRSERNAGMG